MLKTLPLTIAKIVNNSQQRIGKLTLIKVPIFCRSSCLENYNEPFLENQMRFLLDYALLFSI